MRIILLLMVIFTGTGGTVRAEGLLQDGSAYNMETAYEGAAWSYPAESGQTLGSKLSSAEDELPSWGEPLELKEPVYVGEGRSLYRPESCSSDASRINLQMYGGLKQPDDENFINWQKEVYADIDPDLDLNDEDDKLEFIKQLTKFIHEHVTYNSEIHELCYNGGSLTEIRENLYRTIINNHYSTSDIVLNQKGVCKDFTLLEHYMLGQQGIKTEYFSFSVGIFVTGSYKEYHHAAVKIDLGSAGIYIADPTSGITETFEQYISILNEDPNINLPLEHTADYYDNDSSGSIYVD